FCTTLLCYLRLSVVLFFYLSCYGYLRDLLSFPTRRSSDLLGVVEQDVGGHERRVGEEPGRHELAALGLLLELRHPAQLAEGRRADRKSTRLNSSHVKISYAVFCLKKKKISDVIFN